MKVRKFYSAGHTDALAHAVSILSQRGCVIAQMPEKDVTHLLLDAPQRNDPADVLCQLPKDITVIGGNLNNAIFDGYKTIDLLQDPLYLAENAAITAHCAIKLALSELPITLHGCPVLVIGWGRIGKCLASLLQQLGAIVSVSARKESDRAILSALGYDTEDLTQSAYGLVRYRVIFNTVPEMIIPDDGMQYCRPECLKIDLASQPGIFGEDVIQARGLPNKYAPESSGELIARNILRLLQRKEL